MEEEKISIDDAIEKLVQIKKEEISERSFFHGIINVFRQIDLNLLTEEKYVELSNTLISIGCEDYKTWKEKKPEKERHSSKEYNIKNIESGEIYIAEIFINQILSSYNGAKFGFARMSDPNNNWFSRWLEGSQRKLDKENSQRGKKENAIRSKSTKKRSIIEAIRGIQDKIKSLRKDKEKNEEEINH